MRVAAIYDIHGNLPALEAVLDDVDAAGVDQIVVGGDVIPGPMPCESIEALLDLAVPVRYISGNGEREVLAERSGSGTGTLPEAVREVIRWVAGRLSAEEAGRLAGWPSTLRLQIAGLGQVLFCHATPRSDADLFTRVTPDAGLLPAFESADAPLVICGHTHMQFDRMVGDVRVVNAGSVGMPFAEPGAYWLMLGPGVELRRTAYDLEGAADRIRATDYPHAEEFAAGNVLRPPTEAEMSEVFERAAASGLGAPPGAE